MAYSIIVLDGVAAMPAAAPLHQGRAAGERDTVRLRYWLALATLIGAVAYYGHVRDLPGRFAEYQQRRQQVEALRDELHAKEMEKASLERRVQDLESDPVEIEAAIREAEKKVRQNETIYRIERSAPGGAAVVSR